MQTGAAGSTQWFESIQMRHSGALNEVLFRFGDAALDGFTAVAERVSGHRGDAKSREDARAKERGAPTCAAGITSRTERAHAPQVQRRADEFARHNQADAARANGVTQ
jgi:hypothetical protein